MYFHSVCVDLSSVALREATQVEVNVGDNYS